MTARQAAFLTSRIISLWFFYKAFMSFAQLPSVYVSISMARTMRGNPEWTGLLRRSLARISPRSRAPSLQFRYRLLLHRAQELPALVLRLYRSLRDHWPSVHEVAC